MNVTGPIHFTSSLLVVLIQKFGWQSADRSAGQWQNRTKSYNSHNAKNEIRKDPLFTVLCQRFKILRCDAFNNRFFAAGVEKFYNCDSIGQMLIKTIPSCLQNPVFGNWKRYMISVVYWPSIPGPKIVFY